MAGEQSVSITTGVKQGEVIFAALELSKSKWLLAIQSPISDKISLHRIDGGDTDRLVTLIRKSQDRAEKKWLNSRFVGIVVESLSIRFGSQRDGSRALSGLVLACR